MGLSPCCCQQKECDQLQELKCMQIFYRAKEFKLLQVQAGERKQIVRIKLVQKVEERQNQFLQSSTHSSRTYESEIIGELQENGIKLCTQNIYETLVSRSILMCIHGNEAKEGTVIFVQQPLCSDRVNLPKIYEHTFRGLLTANAELEQSTNIPRVRSSMGENEKAKVKVKVVLHWDRLGQKAERKVIERVLHRLKAARAEVEQSRARERMI